MCDLTSGCPEAPDGRRASENQFKELVLSGEIILCRCHYEGGHHRRDQDIGRVNRGPDNQGKENILIMSVRTCFGLDSILMGLP